MKPTLWSFQFVDDLLPLFTFQPNPRGREGHVSWYDCCYENGSAFSAFSMPFRH